ncbi:hypothetical protein EON65_58030, partial [archaeon]
MISSLAYRRSFTEFRKCLRLTTYSMSSKLRKLCCFAIYILLFEFIILLTCEGELGGSKSYLCSESLLLDPVALAQHLVNSPKVLQAQIAIVTSVTPDIVPKYAGYSIAVNALYAEHLGYAYHVYVEGQQIDLPLDADPRWNKVLFLLRTMQTSKYQYVVWMDADLVILDFSLDLQAIASQYSEADIIMSKDKASAPFIGNTGLIIIRNNVWSIGFLYKW